MSNAAPIQVIKGGAVGDPIANGARGAASFNRDAPSLREQQAPDLGRMLAGLSRHRQLVEAEAAAVLDAARAEAAAIVAAAEGRAEESRRRAYEAGYSAGEAEGQQKAWTEAEALLDTLRTAVKQAEQVRHEAVELARDDILKLATAIAEKIIRTRAATDSEMVARLLDDLLPRWEGARAVRIRCHPDQARQVNDYLERTGWAERLTSVSIVPCDQISPGGCVLESELGELDAQWESRLERTTEQLVRWLGLEVTSHER